MQKSAVGKKEYRSPSLAVIGALADKTKTGDWWKKRAGPGDQFIFTDPPNCWDGHFYNNCEAASA